MMKVTVELENLDLVLLRRQKRTLVGRPSSPSRAADEEYEAVEGMINLLDHIQDFLVDSGQATEFEVFGPRDGDGRLDEDAEAILQEANKALHG
jgi:hypothetical protein